jgi:maleate isomerase
MSNVPNVVGPRGRFAVIIPSTNTVVEQDLMAIRPDGVSFHYGRMYISSPGLASDADFEALLGQIRGSISTAVRDVVTCNPTYMLMGMSAETFWGGVEGNTAFEQRISEQSGGLRVSTGASACRDALKQFGAKRIAVFSPYQPVADRQVGTFFTEAGFDVRAITGLRCATATAIAEVSEDTIAETIAAIDSPEVDAIVQVGTNLSFVNQAVALEASLGKPVISINTATLWHALRANGITDQPAGFGRLLQEF